MNPILWAMILHSGLMVVIAKLQVGICSIVYFAL